MVDTLLAGNSGALPIHLRIRDVYGRTIEMPQLAHILKANCCKSVGSNIASVFGLMVHSHLGFIRRELLRALFSPCNCKNGYITHY